MSSASREGHDDRVGPVRRASQTSFGFALRLDHPAAGAVKAVTGSEEVGREFLVRGQIEVRELVSELEPRLVALPRILLRPGRAGAKERLHPELALLAKTVGDAAAEPGVIDDKHRFVVVVALDVAGNTDDLPHRLHCVLARVRLCDPHDVAGTHNDHGFVAAESRDVGRDNERQPARAPLLRGLEVTERDDAVVGQAGKLGRDPGLPQRRALAPFARVLLNPLGATRACGQPTAAPSRRRPRAVKRRDLDPVVEARCEWNASKNSPLVSVGFPIISTRDSGLVKKPDDAS